MKVIKNKRGQLAIEASIILVILVDILLLFWLNGPLQEAEESWTDVNAVALGQNSLLQIASAVREVNLGGIGAKQDFMIHIPFNTVDIQDGDGSGTYSVNETLEGRLLGKGPFKNGPYVNLTLITYRPAGDLTVPFTVNENGEFYTGSDSIQTPFYAITLVQGIDAPLENFPLCAIKENASEARTGLTRFYFATEDGQRDIKFCSEAGFNVFLYLDKTPFYTMRMLPRHYYTLPENWDIKL